MAEEGFQRRAARLKLAELLREPLERVALETRLRKLGRYDVGVAQELLRVFGVELPEERLQQLERVKDLLESIENAPRGRGAVRPSPAAASAAVFAPPAAPALEAPATLVPPPPPGTYECASLYDEARGGAAAVYCSDGRLGEQMDEFLSESQALARYDRVACPGGPVALSGRLLSFWECRGVEEQLRYLVRAHELRTVVLIAHDGCGYYREQLKLPAASLEAEQRRDLEAAAATLVRIAPGLEVRAFFARRVSGRVRFEPGGGNPRR